MRASCFSHVQLFATLWTVARQAPLSTGFSRPEYWSGLPCPPPGDLPNPGIKPTSFMPPALAGGLFTTSATWEALFPPPSSFRRLPSLSPAFLQSCPPSQCLQLPLPTFPHLPPTQASGRSFSIADPIMSHPCSESVSNFLR